MNTPAIRETTRVVFAVCGLVLCVLSIVSNKIPLAIIGSTYIVIAIFAPEEAG